MAVSAGICHALGLLDNGQVVCWGIDQDGAVSGMENAMRGERRPCVAISAGWHCSLALLDDGRVVCWGDHYWCYENGVKRALPTDRRYVAIHARFPVGLLNNGDIIMSHRCLPRGYESTWRDEVVHCHGLIDITAGQGCVLGLLENGQVIGWGRNDNDGQITGGTKALKSSGGDRYIAIAAGLSFSVGLTNNGRIVFWGSTWGVNERMASPPAGRHFVV